MTPPPAFALLLLGSWILFMGAVTMQAGYEQWRVSQHIDPTGSRSPESALDRATTADSALDRSQPASDPVGDTYE